MIKEASSKGGTGIINLINANNNQSVIDYVSTDLLLNPSLASKSEYLRNKIQKKTDVINLKPEIAGMTDQRIAENSFNTDA